MDIEKALSDWAEEIRKEAEAEYVNGLKPTCFPHINNLPKSEKYHRYMRLYRGTVTIYDIRVSSGNTVGGDVSAMCYNLPDDAGYEWRTDDGARHPILTTGEWLPCSLNGFPVPRQWKHLRAEWPRFSAEK